MRTLNLIPVLTLSAGFAVAQPAPLKDHPACKDLALFTRMPGFFMPYDSYCKQTQFDTRAFVVQKGTTTTNVDVEGRKLEYLFTFDQSGGQTPPSSLQVQRNFQNAVLKLGGKVMYTEKGGYYRTTLVVNKDGKETWAEVSTSGNPVADRYYINIVEREAMKQDVTANADALKGGLAESGHVEVPGIFFDFNKADIKPESQPALQETAKLLKGNPAMRVWVVGHTDNIGTADANLKLSGARAAAVVAALVQAGIDVKRMASFGAGPFAPVVANTTDEGRARNRRVELVLQP
jgi:outer membrane protein OmpA-like peptidoglycan-associated protein